MEEKEDFPENEEKGDLQKECKNYFGRAPGFSEFLQGGKMDVNKLNLLKENKKTDPSKTHFTVENMIFLKKGDSEIQRGDYQIKQSSVSLGRKRNRERNTLRCGGDTDQSGKSRANRYLWVLGEASHRENQKC